MEAASSRASPARGPRPPLERILASRTFQGKDTLKHLLTYLVEKSLDGTAEDLKEYTVGVEAFGKPRNYDPQLDASVRVQAGKLRQKLEDYYRSEGSLDEWVIEFPKGRFALEFHRREHRRFISPALTASRILLYCSLAVLGGLAGWAVRGRLGPSPVSPTPEAIWESADLETLWKPFFQSDRPVIASLGTMPFYHYDQGFVREPILDVLAPPERDQRVHKLQATLGSRRMIPWDHYTGVGEANGIFLLSRFFTKHHRGLDLIRSTALTWEDITSHNVILVGSSKPNVHLKQIPVAWAFEVQGDSIVNLHPNPGEPHAFNRKTAAADDTILLEDHALISLAPGLSGRGEVLAFGSASDGGLWAAVQYLTENSYVRPLAEKFKSGGAIPRHFQVVIWARFQSMVPIEIRYVTHRRLD